MASRSHYAAPVLLAVVVVLIVYVSLYPFRFVPEGRSVADALGLLAAWLMLWRGDAKRNSAEPLETIAITVTAVVLLLLPLVEVGADPVAGLVGGLVGLAMGALAARRAEHVD